MGGVASRVESGEGTQYSQGMVRGCSLKSTCEAHGGGGYVKLVQAGGKVVQVRGPVRAGDVMRSTQHYVTRPDVFRVVPPEAALITPDTILLPGHKFYLVTFPTLVSLLRQEHLSKPPNRVVEEAPSDQPEKNKFDKKTCLPVLLHRQRGNAKKSSHHSGSQSSRGDPSSLRSGIFQDRSNNCLSFHSGQGESFQSDQGNHLLIKSRSSGNSQSGSKSDVLQRSRLAPTYTQGFHSDQVDRSLITRSKSLISSSQESSCKSESFLSDRGGVSSMRTNQPFRSKPPLLSRSQTYPSPEADKFQISQDNSSSKFPQSSEKENLSSKSNRSTPPLSSHRRYGSERGGSSFRSNPSFHHLLSSLLSRPLQSQRCGSSRCFAVRFWFSIVGFLSRCG